MAAQADVQGPAPRIVLPMHCPALPAPIAPQVLTPVAARGFPDWLAERVRYARLASGRAAGRRRDPARAPAIAIVIDDLGPDVDGTRRAIALPKAVTLSFLPYGDDTPALARAGERAGHQIIVHVPMEPEGREDPGPMALRTDLPPGQNLHRLDWALSRVPGHAGINNHMGSRFTPGSRRADPGDGASGGARHVLPRFAHDAAFAGHAAGARLRRRQRRPRCLPRRCAERGDMSRISSPRPNAIARETGVAIAIGHPHAVTLAALKPGAHSSRRAAIAWSRSARPSA